MSIKGFDYKRIAKDLAEQANKFVPADLCDSAKEYLIKTLENFTLLSGEALYNDSSIKLNAEQALLITQIVSEWTFHKCIDLARSGIDSKYWDAVMQKIAFTVFEVTKQATLRELPQEQIVQAAEHHVVKAYNAAIDELLEEKKITEEIVELAKAQSNIDKLAEETGCEKEECLKKYDYDDFEVEEISSTKMSLFQKIKEFFFSHHDCKKAEKELEDIRQKMEDLHNPNKMYERLGVDILSLQVGQGLLPIVDPDQDGFLRANIAALRQKLTDDYGYIIPNVRIMDTHAIEEYEYCISVRGNVVDTGFVYPEKYMVIADEWDEKCGEIPEDAIIGVDPTYKTQCCWVSEETAKENADNAKFIDATDVIIQHFRKCVIKHVDEILTDNDVEKYIALAKYCNPSQVNYLLEYLSIYDIRRIFVNLIREKVSIKDICFIFMKLCEFVKYSTDVVTLSEKLRTALARQICLTHVAADKVLYAVELSPSKEKLLTDSCVDTETNRMFELESNQVQEILEATASALMKTKQYVGEQPVLLVNPRIRPALYNLLIRHIPTIVVLSYAELIDDIKVESLDKIE